MKTNLMAAGITLGVLALFGVMVFIVSKYPILFLIAMLGLFLGAITRIIFVETRHWLNEE